MNNYEIIVYWSIEDNAFIAEVPELAGCMADGQTYDVTSTSLCGMLTLPNKGNILAGDGNKGATMRTSVNIDDTLLAEAMKISGMSTKAAVLNMALQEYLRKNNLKKILKYRGKNIWEGDLNEMRKAR